MKKRPFVSVMCVAAALVLLIPAVSYAGSSHQMPTPTPDYRVTPNEQDGIPTPIVDGAFHYWGEGRFTTDSGQEFFWKIDRFENADGTPLEIPERLRPKFLAAGIGPIGQPTRPGTQQVPPANEGDLQAQDYSDGYYVHVGQVRTVDHVIDAYQADMNCYDRSPGYSSYNWVGFINTNGYALSWEAYCFTQNWVVPFAHFTYESGPDFQHQYWDYQFNVQSASWHNFKVARQASGTWNVYFDSTPVDYNLYWPYSPCYNVAVTQVELTSNSRSAPHNPANHIGSIKLRYQGTSTWYTQDASRSVVTDRWLKSIYGSFYTPAYGRIWLIYPNNDWEMVVN